MRFPDGSVFCLWRCRNLVCGLLFCNTPNVAYFGASCTSVSLCRALDQHLHAQHHQFMTTEQKWNWNALFKNGLAYRFLRYRKARVWNRAGFHPPDIDDQRPEVWKRKAWKMATSPVGADRFVDLVSTKNLNEEKWLWETLVRIPHLQNANEIILERATSRCHHFLRTVIFRQSALYAAEGHNWGMRMVMAGMSFKKR